MSSRHPQLHFILLLLTYYRPTYNAAKGSNGITVQCLPDQALSLLQLKHSFHNPDLSSWQHGTDCCHWEGVGCDRASGQVITLDLSYRSLQSTGGLSSALFNLTSLRSLSLSGNDFNHASLPSFGFERLTELLSLELSETGLSGQIPIGIAHLEKLLTLDISYNDYLYLREPQFQTLVANLTNLRDLYLNEVDISSSGPTWSVAIADSVPLLQNLDFNSLSTLKLRENRFHGMLPENIGEGCMLQTIDLNNNLIEGKIPRSLSNCQGLELFDVGNNQIIGSFPSWLGVLPRLRVLVLRFNQLNGTIRDFKGDHTINNYFANLQILDLASNNFSGNLPEGWFNELKAMMENVSDGGEVLGHETYSGARFYQDTVTITFKGFDLSFTKILSTFNAIDFSNNSFDGPVPESIGRLVALRGLNMSYNNFMGQIPFQYRNLSQLEAMDLSWNQITGEIPQELTSLTSLEWLNLSYNNLYGRIPQGNQFSTFSDSSFEGNAGLCGVPLSKHCDNQSSISPTGVAPPESEGLWQDKLGIILFFAFVGLGFGVGFALSFLLRLYCRVEGWICKQAWIHM
ncbi:receptor-like protein 9DC3 [Triticum dicoccoides]|uniref:receptor-like protein 9DC3 n=1 Tax=Triticum dicoccoides TaxID=85692 RepID=UPI00188FAD2B|nr:receptor-like protein 9DC3 [Triticum dicoccoides]XP_044347470.1 receptor-like protein 9DC3 [Triticum aestivum]